MVGLDAAAVADGPMISRLLVCRERSIVGGDGGRFTTPPPSRLEARCTSVRRPRMSLVLQPFLPFPHSCQGPSPHQQGRGERMIEQCFGGIDVSLDRLDVLLLPQGTGFSRNRKPGRTA